MTDFDIKKWKEKQAIEGIYHATLELCKNKRREERYKNLSAVGTSLPSNNENSDISGGKK